MITRVRDKVRDFKPQDVIAFEEWDQIIDRHNRAVAFMDVRNPLYNMLIAELKEAEEMVLMNRIHEVREIRIITEFLQKIFITSKKEQVDEVVGTIKFIRGYLAELQLWIAHKEELERLEADGKIVIRRANEQR